MWFVSFRIRKFRSVSFFVLFLLCLCFCLLFLLSFPFRSWSLFFFLTVQNINIALFLLRKIGFLFEAKPSPQQGVYAVTSE